ncbi:MAG: PASTA domain-containing protein [Gemmatimonadota bacterium]
MRRAIRDLPRLGMPRDFARRRAVVERRRSATWQVGIALVVATLGAGSLGYLVVQLFYLPDTLAEARLNRVPDLTGRDLDDAIEIGEAQGYVVLAGGEQYSDDVSAGEVIFTFPPPGHYLLRGDTLLALVSLGDPRSALPSLAGLEPTSARTILRQLGVDSVATRRATSDLFPDGDVVGTDPPAGTAIDDDLRLVTLILSRGGSVLAMPDVRGLTLTAARDTLEAHGLTVGDVTGVRGPLEEEVEGDVIVSDQDPPPGGQVRVGTAIELELGIGPRRPAPRVTPRTDAANEDGAPEDGEEAAAEDEAPDRDPTPDAPAAVNPPADAPAPAPAGEDEDF